MDDKKNKAAENTTQPTQPVRTPKVATQKTFQFDKGVTPDQMDDAVNHWLMEQSKKGQACQLGKTFSNHANGRIYIVYMYGRDLE